MNTSRVLTLLLVLVAVFVFVVAMFFFFGKKGTKTETTEESLSTVTPGSTLGGKKVLNVLTYLPPEKAYTLKSNLGESYLFDAKFKLNSYEYNGVTVSVFKTELENLPGYTKYVHTLSKPFKGESVVFDGETSNHFFEDPVVRLTSYMWFDTLLFLTLTTETESEPKVTKFYHYTGHKTDNKLRWDRFDRDPTRVLDTSVLGPKLDEVNQTMGNLVVLNLDEYLDDSTGTYYTELEGVRTTFNLFKRSSSQTGFVKVTHKLGNTTQNTNVKPFKVKMLTVSGTELNDLVLPNKPVVSLSVFWWYNVPLLSELELYGGDKQHLSYNVDTNNWELELVDKLRSKLFLLKNRLGDPLTLDLSRTPESDQTYTSNGVLVRVTPGATSVSKDFKKYTHRFTSSSAHFVGTFVNSGTLQMGLPVVRLNELSAYYLSGVPVLLKLNLATAGSLTTKHRFYSNNGYGLWNLVELTDENTTTESLLKKYVEETKKMVAENDKYVLDARMKSNYLSQDKLVKVAKENFNQLQGFSLFNHKSTDGTSFKFEKFTVAGKDVSPSAEELLVGAEYGKVYWFMEEPLLLKVHGTTTKPPTEDKKESTTVQYNHFFSYNGDTKEWKKVEKDLDNEQTLKELLQEVRSKLGTVTLNLANSTGEYKSGLVTVNVVEATPFDNDPPTSFTKRVHTLSVPFPVDNLKHYDFNLALARKDESQRQYAVPVKDPVLPVGLVVTKLEVYFYGEVPLHFVVYSTGGTPLRYSNTFQGTLWMKDEYSTTVPLVDVLVPLRVRLGHFAKLDVCRDAPTNTEVTYKLKHLAGTGYTNVKVGKSVVDADGVTVVTHKLPENVNLKFTNLTCGDKVMAGMDMETISKVFMYSRNSTPLFVKTNSDPKFYVPSGDGALKRYTPPDGATTLTDEQMSATVSRVAKTYGNVYDVDVLKKQEYQLHGTTFTVVKEVVKDLLVKFVHKLKVNEQTELTPFVVRLFKHGDLEAVLFPTGLQLVWFVVYYYNEKPLYLRLKTYGNKSKFYHYVYDNGLWLSDGVYDNFDEEEVLDRLEYLKDGLGNQFSLNLGEDVDNPLFKTDVVNFDLVPGFVKHTYKPVGLEYPLLLQNLTLEGYELNLPLVEKHMNLFTAYSFRKNFLFFHVVSYDNKDLFFKANFQGGFVPHTFETFDDVSLKNELFNLRSKLSNQFSLELTNKESYNYHNFNVKVVKQVQTQLEGYDKYMHDLVENETSVPFKLVSVKDNGYVTNVPEFKELVYFAYVYMHDDTPLMLELHSSTMERTDYHYYYFYNNLGNWQLLQNPTLGQLSNTRVKEVLERSRNQLSKTFKLDLSRKFSYKFTNGTDDKYYLESLVGEDPRYTLGFSLYGHDLTLKKGKDVVEGVKPPTAENLGGVTVMPVEHRTTVSTPAKAPENTTPKTVVPPPVVPPTTSTGTTQPSTGTPTPAGSGTTTASGTGAGETVVSGTVPAVPAQRLMPDDRTTTPVEVKPAGLALAPKAAVPTTEVVSGTSRPVEPPVSGQEVTSTTTEPVLTTYETLLANALRGVNLLAGDLPVVSKVTVGNKVVSGFGVDTVLKVNVYWWHDQFPAFVHLFNGMEHKYYSKQLDNWVLVNKVEQELTRSELGKLLLEVRETFVKPVEVDLDKSSNFDPYVKYVSEGLTLRVVPSYNFEDGFKGFTHFSATQYERAFKANKLTLWGDVVVTDLPHGYVKSVTVFTDADLLPLAAEVEWTKSNNSSSLNKYKYYKNGGTNGWVVHHTDDPLQRLNSDVLLDLLKTTKETLGERVVLGLEKRENYNVSVGTTPLEVRVVKEPTSRSDSWNGYHKVRHEFTATNARVLLLKHGDRVLRAHHVNTYVKAVDTFWFKNVLLLVRLTVAGPRVTQSDQTAEVTDTYVFFKNDFKEDLMPFDPQLNEELNLTTPTPLLVELATPYKDHYHLDVAERTLRNSVDFVKYLPALYVVDTAVPQGFARYNLYVLDHLQGVKLGKLLYHGRDVSTGNFNLPEYNVNSVYVFTPVGHFSPFLLEFHVRGPNKLLNYYYHLNQFGEWVALETGFRSLTSEELHNKLSVLTANLGNVNVVDLSKTEGSYYGLNKLDVTKFEFPGARGFTKYLHKPQDGNPFTVSKFVNKGVVLDNLPVLKVNHVAVYNTHGGKPLLLELRLGGKYKFFASNSNGSWYEERLPSGDLLSALNRVYDEHADVARTTGNLVSLHLNTDFVREYVLTEGKVEDFEGSVAVPEDEPVPVPAQRLMPDDPNGGEPDLDVTTTEPTLEGATRPTQPPSVTVTRSHVLNPVLYLESDKLSYSYASYGKTVFVTRRDDMFHGYNVTVHKLPENEPFVLRRLVFLGTEFDLGVGDVKLLSATSFSFLHTPLVLKLVLETGSEKYYSFNFPTQTWTTLNVDDLEEQLDKLNFQHNKMVVVDLGKDDEYSLYDQKLVVEKATFGQYTRLTTVTKKAAESKAKRTLKKNKKLAKKVEYKTLLKSELDKKTLKLNELKTLLAEKKKVYDDLLVEWGKVDSEGVETHKKTLVLLDAVVKLEKVVPELEKQLETVKTVGNAEKVKEKEKELAAKKTELTEKKAELAKLVPEKTQETQEKSKETLETELKKVLDEFFKAADPLNPTPTKPTEPTDAEEKWTKVFNAFLVADKFKNAAVQADALKEAVANEQEFKNAYTVVTKVKGLVADSLNLQLALDAVNTVPGVESVVGTLKTLVETAKEVTAAVNLLTPVQELGGGSDLTPKYKSAAEVNKGLKSAFTNKTEPFKTLYEHFLDLKNKVEVYVLKERALYAFNSLVYKLVLRKNEAEKLSKDFEGAVNFFNEFKELEPKAKNVLKFGVTTVSNVQDYTAKLNALVTAFNNLGEFLKPESVKKVEKLLAFDKKLKDLEAAPAKLQEAVDLATKLKEKFVVLEGATEPSSEVDSTDVDKFVDFAKALKVAYVNVGTKVDDLYKFVKALKSDATGLDKFSEANQELNKLQQHVTTFFASEKEKGSVTDPTERRRQLFEAAKTFKSGVKTASFDKEKLNLTDPLTKVKEALTTVKNELNTNARGEFKSGVDSAKELYEQVAVQVLLQEEVVKEAAKNHDQFKTDVEVSDSDDDGTVDTSLLFGFGGLRFNGKDLPVAGLPLGTHLHTLNAFFPTGYSKPLMLQLKYRDSDELDEPVLERLLAPPPAEVLTVADRQTVPVVPAGTAPLTTGAPGPAVTPVSTLVGVTGTVQKVTELLKKGLQQTVTNVGVENQPVVTPAVVTSETATGATSGTSTTNTLTTAVASSGTPSSTTTTVTTTGTGSTVSSTPVSTTLTTTTAASGSTTTTTPTTTTTSSTTTTTTPSRTPTPLVTPKETAKVEEVFVYPGRFFVWDVDGTWKQFVPEGKGTLKTKLDELKVKHSLTLDLDLAKVPGTRRMGQYFVDTENFVVRRLLVSSSYKLTREVDTPNNLQGTESTKPVVGPNVVNLDDFDPSVKFFPDFKYHWFLHHKAPVLGTENKVVDPLPPFKLNGLNLNGVPLELDEQVPNVLTQVHSVSTLLNENDTPLLLFFYKPVQSDAVVRHNYVVLSLKGNKYVVDDSFGNYHDLLYKFEHTQFVWTSDSVFDHFRALLVRRLEEVDMELEPSYAVDLGPTAHYKKTGVVVNVEVSEAFGVKHVSYTPGLVPEETVVSGTVPAFVLQKVFWNETVFKGFKLPARNVLHVTAFHWKFLHLLKDEAKKEFTEFPLLLELSFRNENNRLVHHYYQYLGGDRFELHSKTKLRLTASEVADVVKTVAFNNLRVSKGTPNVLNLDLSLQFTHYTPGHKFLVYKRKKVVTPPVVPPTTSTGTTQPSTGTTTVVNGFVPDGYVLYEFTLHKDDPGYKFVRLFFGKFWTYLPTKFNYKLYYAYVKEHDTLPVLVAMGYSETTGPMKFDWVGLNGNKPTVLFDKLTVSPVVEADKPKVEAELNKLTSKVDFWLKHKPVLWNPVKPGLTVKLAPVGGLGGFPKRKKKVEEAPAKAPEAPTPETSTAPKVSVEQPVVPTQAPLQGEGGTTTSAPAATTNTGTPTSAGSGTTTGAGTVSNGQSPAVSTTASSGASTTTTSSTSTTPTPAPATNGVSSARPGGAGQPEASPQTSSTQA